MQVQAANQTATDLSPLQLLRSKEKNLQSVFSQVLAEAGRAGYASAKPVDSDESLQTQTAAAWESWYRTELSGKYASPEHDREQAKVFGNVLQRAQNEGGYVDPKGFLGSLTRDELAAVQHLHWLVDPIDVGSLTEEGALNLLLPSAAQVDLNGDGITMSGKSMGLRFPDSSTPPDVVAAWDKATENMPFEDRIIFELQMLMPILTANIVINEDGSYSHTIEPGDPDFRNPMAGADLRYFLEMSKGRIAHLDYLKYQMPAEQYQKGHAFWSDFQQLLEAQQ